MRGGVACEWVRVGYLDGHSQAHGMKEQATQPQESPPQHPQRPPQTGGRPLPPHPHQTVGTSVPHTLCRACKFTRESKECTQSTPLTFGVVQEEFKTGPRRMYSP